MKIKISRNSYDIVAVSNVTGQVVDSIGSLVKAVYEDLTASWHKPVLNLSWRLMVANTNWEAMPIDSEEAQLDLPF